MTTFHDLKLHPRLLDVIANTYHFAHPTQIQARVVPLLNKENPFIFTAETGSGKTLAYLLPILDYYLHAQVPFTNTEAESIKALFLAPTRLLARQIADELQKFGVSANIFIGGERERQTSSIFAVATPGKALLTAFGKLDYLVLDEGDKLMEMPDAASLVRKFRKSRLVVCSATVGRLRELGSVFRLLTSEEGDGQASLGNKELEIPDGNVAGALESAKNAPKREKQTSGEQACQWAKTQSQIELARESAQRPAGDIIFTAQNEFVVPASLQIEFAPVLQKDKMGLLFKLIERQHKTAGSADSEQQASTKTVVFALTCAFARYLTQILRARFQDLQVYNLSGKMHSKMQQNQLQQFRKSASAVLVTTDVASRGLDVESIGTIIQFDLPKQIETLVHRAGRSARAGRAGRCICLCYAWEAQITDILRNRGLIVDVAPEACLTTISTTTGGSAEHGQPNSKHTVTVNDTRYLLPQEVGQYPHGKEIQFLRTQLNKIQAMLEKETVKPQSASSAQMSASCQAQIAQLMAKIRPLEAQEDQFNAAKFSAFDAEPAAFQRQLLQADAHLEALANEAFVSYVRGYQEHEMKFLCDFSKLDTGQLAMSMGLLRLPKMREIERHTVFRGERCIRAAMPADLDSEAKSKQQDGSQVNTDARGKAEAKIKGQQTRGKKGQKTSELGGNAAKKAGANEEPQQKPSVQMQGKFSSEIELLRQYRQGKLSEEDLERLL